MSRSYPSHLRLFGGEQVMYGPRVVHRLFIQDPLDHKTYSLETPQDTFEKVMALLGMGEENAKYCGKCGSISNVRPVIDSHGHDGGFAEVCMCRSKYLRS